MFKSKKLKSIYLSEIVKVGDVYVSHWGYEQTNVSFYKVVRVLNRSVEFVGIRKIRVPSKDKKYELAVEPHKTTAVDLLKRFKRKPFVSYDEKTKEYDCSFRITNYQSASKWDGFTQYETNPLYGH